MAAATNPRGRPTTGRSFVAVHLRAATELRLLDHEPFHRDFLVMAAVIFVRVGHGRTECLLQKTRGLAWRELQNLQRARRAQALNLAGHIVAFLRRDAGIFGDG